MSQIDKAKIDKEALLEAMRMEQACFFDPAATMRMESLIMRTEEGEFDCKAEPSPDGYKIYMRFIGAVLVDVSTMSAPDLPDDIVEVEGVAMFQYGHESPKGLGPHSDFHPVIGEAVKDCGTCLTSYIGVSTYKCSGKECKTDKMENWQPKREGGSNGDDA